jgi:D-lyxose ketol-isomerase
MRRQRNQSMHFHSQQQVDFLNLQNEKIISRLMYIARRKSNSFFKEEEPKMVYY